MTTPYGETNETNETSESQETPQDTSTDEPKTEASTEVADEDKPDWDVSTHGEPDEDQAKRYNVVRPGEGQ